MLYSNSLYNVFVRFCALTCLSLCFLVSNVVVECRVVSVKVSMVSFYNFCGSSRSELTLNLVRFSVKFLSHQVNLGILGALQVSLLYVLSSLSLVSRPKRCLCKVCCYFYGSFCCSSHFLFHGCTGYMIGYHNLLLC
jgi:hypothetical protein